VSLSPVEHLNRVSLAWPAVAAQTLGRDPHSRECFMNRIMSPKIMTIPIRVDTGSVDEEGRLVLAGGRLVAVLLRLADEIHGDSCGGWFLEAGFGDLAGENRLFSTLEGAAEWLRQRLDRSHQSEPSYKSL
jgi:hypothetical protein